MSQTANVTEAFEREADKIVIDLQLAGFEADLTDLRECGDEACKADWELGGELTALAANRLGDELARQMATALAVVWVGEGMWTMRIGGRTRIVRIS